MRLLRVCLVASVFAVSHGLLRGAALRPRPRTATYGHGHVLTPSLAYGPATFGGWFRPRTRAILNAADEPKALSAEQLKALDEVAQSLKQCGDTRTVFGGARSFYSAIFTPGEATGAWTDPSPEDWEAIRTEWNELEDCSDELLMSQLPTMRAKRRDYRELKKLDLNTMGPHSVRSGR